jgi:ribosomal protein S18 acetylase RimI-like enzyme
VNIRRATSDDRETLLDLWQEFAEDSFPAWAARRSLGPGHRETTLASWREGTAAGIDESLRLGTAFVAERDGEPAGFAAAVPRGSREAELTELYVRPEVRRDGVATALVREVVSALEALGVEYVVVETAVDNLPAQAAYERWGFRARMLAFEASLAQIERHLGR